VSVTITVLLNIHTYSNARQALRVGFRANGAISDHSLGHMVNFV